MASVDISNGPGRTEQRKRRAELLPLAYGRPCPYCGYVMTEGQALDLDHWPPRMLTAGMATVPQTLRIAHAYCNRRAGQRLALAIRKRRRLVSRTRW